MSHARVPSRYRPSRLLRNPHLQSLLSSAPLRRMLGQRLLDRTGTRTSEHVIEVDGGVRLLGFHSHIPEWAPRGQLRLCARDKLARDSAHHAAGQGIWRA